MNHDFSSPHLTIARHFHAFTEQLQPDAFISIHASHIDDRRLHRHNNDWYWRRWTRHIDTLCYGRGLRLEEGMTWIVRKEEVDGVRFHALVKFSPRRFRHEAAHTDTQLDGALDARLWALHHALLSAIRTHTPRIMGRNKRLDADSVVDVGPVWTVDGGGRCYAPYLLKELPLWNYCPGNFNTHLLVVPSMMADRFGFCPVPEFEHSFARTA